ncbi:MAG: ribose-phosphate diphosphokinase [Candidatus Pacearchaeota archaeon]|nr:ribose-phosphate diphosphokinase [Candidatus Pacearchaeota archaeon]
MANGLERVILADRASPCVDFAQSVYENIQKLETERGQLGFKMGYVDIAKFPDSEFEPRIEGNCRGRHVIFIHDSSKDPATWWVEMVLVNDAAKRAAAERIINVFPYFRWGRGEKKDKPHTPIPSKVLLDTIKADRVIGMDLHAPALQGFTNIPFDNLYSYYCSVPCIVDSDLEFIENLVVAAPDVGSVKLARAYSKRIMECLAKRGNPRDVGLAIVDKNRLSGDKVETGEVMGNVRDKNVLITDDILSSAGTLKAAWDALMNRGAREVRAYATHFVGAGNYTENLKGFRRVFTTNSFYQPLGKIPANVELIDVSPLFSRAIYEAESGGSISELFKQL